MDLTKRDWVFIALIVFAWLGAVLAVRALLTDWTPIFALGLVLGIALTILFDLYRRLLGALKHYNERPSVNYRQVESLFSLFASLPINRPLPPMRVAAASPDFAVTLVGLIRETRPRVIVELGSGVSTLIAAYCIKQNGQGVIVSLEQDARYAEVTRKALADRGLHDVARVIHAPLREVPLNGRRWLWYDTDTISSLDSIDLLVVDGPLQEGQTGRMLRYPALPLLHTRLGPRAVVLLDDADREDERRVVDLWKEEFPQLDRQYVPSEKGTVILKKRA